MKLPLTYNLRNLAVRRTRTLLTVLGMSLSVAVFITVISLVDGLHLALSATGDARNVLVLRKNSSSEMLSILPRDAFGLAGNHDKTARDAKGMPLASLELVTVANLSGSDDEKNQNVTIRGLSTTGIAVRQNVRLSSGRWFAAGRREVVVGRTLLNRLPGLQPGSELQYGSGPWQIVGVMDGGTGAYGSEIWADVNQLSGELNRASAPSSILLQTRTPEDAEALIADLNASRHNVSALRESEYFEAQMGSAIPVQSAGMFVCFILAAGSIAMGMMTMLSSVADRTQEIATLRVLGFNRITISSSFLLESVVLALAAAASAAVLTVPLNWVQASLGSFVTMSKIQFQFHIGAAVLLKAMAFAVALGIVGGLVPAHAASRCEIVSGLRR